MEARIPNLSRFKRTVMHSRVRRIATPEPQPPSFSSYFMLFLNRDSLPRRKRPKTITRKKKQHRSNKNDRLYQRNFQNQTNHELKTLLIYTKKGEIFQI